MRGITDYRMDAGDRLVLVRPDDICTRSNNAVSAVEGFLAHIASRGLEIELDELLVPHRDVLGCAERLLNSIERCDPGCEIYLEATGGVRSICTAMTLVAVLSGVEIAGFATLSEASGTKEQLPVPQLRFALSPSARSILTALYPAPHTRRELERQIGKDASTISRAVGQLLDQRLVTETHNGRCATLELTGWGRLLALSIGSNDR